MFSKLDTSRLARVVASCLLVLVGTFGVATSVGTIGNPPASAGVATSVGTIGDPLAPLVREALRANLSMKGERFAERRAAAEERGALALWLPRVGLSTRFSDVNDVQNLGDLVNPAYDALNRLSGTASFPTDLDLPLVPRHETRLRLAQPLIAEGIRANLSSARARHDAQRWELGAAARRLAATAQIAYLGVASSRRVVEVQEAALDLVRENERVAERLLSAGSATPEALLRARADRADVEQKLAEAQEQERAAARELNRLLGRPLDQPVEAIPDSAFAQPIEIDRDAAVARALAGREEIGEAKASQRMASAARRVATSRYLPSLSFAFDFGFQGRDLAFHDDEDSWTASLIAQIDLVDFGREAARSAAGWDVERSRVAALDVENQVRLDVETAYGAATTAHAAIATAEARLDAARRTFDLVRRRYEEGSASSLELTDARTGLTNAALNRVLTIYSYAMRKVDLERAAALRDFDTTDLYGNAERSR